MSPLDKFIQEALTEHLKTAIQGPWFREAIHNAVSESISQLMKNIDNDTDLLNEADSIATKMVEEALESLDTDTPAFNDTAEAVASDLLNHMLSEGRWTIKFD